MIVSAMTDRARSFMPEIGALSAIRVWTGFRAATPDKLPLIGPLAGATTHYSLLGTPGAGHHDIPCNRAITGGLHAGQR